MDQNTVTLIAAIIAAVVSIATGVFGIITSIKVSKLENLEARKKYEKNITNFELQYKDELWLAGILENGDFDHYNEKSKKRIFNWWTEYTKTHPPIILQPEVDYETLRTTSARRIKWSGNAQRVNQIGVGGKETNYEMPGELPDPEDLF